MIEFIIYIIWAWNFSVENVWTMFLILYIHKIVQISISIKVSCVTLYVLMNLSILSKLLHLWAFWGLVYHFSYSFNICRIYRDVPFFSVIGNLYLFPISVEVSLANVSTQSLWRARFLFHWFLPIFLLFNFIYLSLYLYFVLLCACLGSICSSCSWKFKLLNWDSSCFSCEHIILQV